MPKFTAEELVGRTIKIVIPDDAFPYGRHVIITADGEVIENAYKVVVKIEADSIAEAIVSLYRLDLMTGTGDTEEAPTEIATARDNIAMSCSAIVSEVR